MKTANHVFRLVLLFLLAGLASGLAAAEVRFGPYHALTINSDVIRGVKVDDAGKIWLLLNPAYREKELRVRLSNLEGASYRKWFTGEDELVSPANQDKQPNQWTDWIETEAPFIEYWMSGQLVLHLKKVG
jgi:hypothetical protein